MATSIQNLTPATASSSSNDSVQSNNVNASSDASSKRPVSDAQLAANRANAQLSTGPTSESGRAISSQNRYVHGFCRRNGIFSVTDNESSEDFTQLQLSFMSEYQAKTTTEQLLVRMLTESYWLSMRAQTLQRRFFEHATGYITDEHQYNLYGRYYAQHMRAFHKILNDLLKLKKEKRAEAMALARQNAAPNGFEAQKVQAAAQTLASNRNLPSQPAPHAPSQPEITAPLTQNLPSEVPTPDKMPAAA